MDELALCSYLAELGLSPYEVSPERNYWLVRTSSGNYYNDFLENQYIAIGWNSIRELPETPTNDFLSRISVNENERRPRLAYRQIKRFISEMDINDIILIPSYDSDKVSFGTITSDLYFSEHEDRDFGNHNSCPYIKRRNVRWMLDERRSKLGIELYKLLFSQHTITNANRYSDYIERIINNYYKKDNAFHLIININKENELSAVEITNILYCITNILEILSNNGENGIDLTDFSTKINALSPGKIEFIGNFKTIVAAAIILVSLTGGNVDVGLVPPHININTPGIIRTIHELVAEESKIKFQQALDGLDANIPEQLNRRNIVNPR